MRYLGIDVARLPSEQHFSHTWHASIRHSYQSGPKGTTVQTDRPHRSTAKGSSRQQASRELHERNGALDGLRALAIIAVVLYHLKVSWLPSGHLGVVLFLVLAGYLLTGSVLRRVHTNGAGAVPRIWWRRIKRVWPSMAAMVVLVAALCVVGNHVLLTKLRPDVLPSLLLMANLSYIVRGGSYFAQIGGPSPLMHLWYLGLDFQFMLVWPLGLLLLDRVKDTRKRIIATLVLAVASAIEMAVLVVPEADPTRVYYGPDTRAFAPLVGSALAMAWPLGERPRTRLPLGGRRLEWAGVASLLLLVTLMALVPDTSVLLYRGGMFVAACLCCVTMASLLEGGPLARVLSCKPLTWLGTRSFALYLWHFPLFALLGSIGSTPLTLAGVGLSLLMAEGSYRLFERGALVAWWRRHAAEPLRAVRTTTWGTRAADGRRDGHATAVRFNPPKGAVMGTAVGVIALIATLGLVTLPDETLVPQEDIVNTGAAADQARQVSADDASDGGDIPSGSIRLTAPDSETNAGVYDPVMIGDSVPGDAQPQFKSYFPNGLLDTYVGRSPTQMASVLKGYLDQGVVGNIVILEAFANNSISDDALDAMVNACGNRMVYLVTCHSDNAERTQKFNDAIRRAAERHDNVKVIDWYAYSRDHVEEWLYRDGVHLREAGKDPYVSYLANSVKDDFAAAGGTVTTQDAASGEGQSQAGDASQDS